MKKILALSVLLLSQMAFADTTVFSCVVPSTTNSVTMTVVLGTDISADFITFSLAEKTGSTVFYSQIEKGALQAQLDQGFTNMLVLSDTTSQVDGVITNSGFFAVSKEADGSFSGFLAAKGNVYPLSCTH